MNTNILIVFATTLAIAYYARCKNIELVPFQDTYTPHDSPYCEGTEFASTSPSLIISKTADSHSNGFMAFNILNLTLPISSAILELHIASPMSLTSQKLSFHTIEPTTIWDENLSCIEEPYTNPIPFMTVKIMGKKVITLNVTPILQSLVGGEFAQFGVAIFAENARVAISSRESPSPPVLHVK